MKFVNSVDIGELKEIPRARKSKFDKGKYQQTEDGETGDLHPPVAGCYRESFLIKLAGLYLVIDSKRPGFLTWFGFEKGSFLVALGKHNEATDWLLSFLNFGERVASCDDFCSLNYLPLSCIQKQRYQVVLYMSQIYQTTACLGNSSYV